MNKIISTQLSVMMFLQFFIWGIWFVTLGTYLGTSLNAEGNEIAKAYMTQAWGAILAPFIIGIIADRYFSAQKVLGTLHLIGGVLLYMAAQASSINTFYPYILAYMLIYMPTLALVNSVSFHQLSSNKKAFAWIRAFGTLGWIVSGLLIGYVFLWESKGLLQNTFFLGSACSIGLGIFSFFLPNTPPGQKGEAVNLKSIIGLDALSLLKNRNFLVFFICSILICIPLAFYYQNANLFLNTIEVENAAGKMSYGQISELLLLLFLPYFLKRFGIKKTILFGMLAWGLRYILFAYGDAQSGYWMLFIGIILHGICYDFFFVSGQIYTDAKAGPKIKNAAQGLITLATYGVGMLIGFKLAGYIYDNYNIAEQLENWSQLWMIPAYISFGILLLFLLVFKNEKIDTEKL